MGLSYDAPAASVMVPYMDLGGGLNLRLDPHALQRNELATSINLWSSFDFAVTKRPGNNPFITLTGAIPFDGTHVVSDCLSMLSARFGGKTYVIYCGTNGNCFVAPGDQSSAWRFVGTVSASAAFVTSAQMFDPTNSADTLFICDGKSIPQMLTDPVAGSFSNVATGTGKLPLNFAGSAGITPQYVATLGNNSHLFYSGEPTNPSAVYISDPFFSQNFTDAAMQVNPDVGAAYNPAIVGNNDGVNGGPITGLATLSSAMIVFKESAIYAMVQTTLLGEVPAWQVLQVSNATGNHAPRSIVAFMGFLVFLSIDGVYITDGNTVTQISADVGPVFDNTLSGFPATIANPQLAEGVRMGNRYVLFYATTGNTFCNQGLWFDFTKQSRFGNPIAGMIQGMTPGGMIALRGPYPDTGYVVWGDATQNRVGVWGDGFADFGNAFTAMLVGKADMFDDVFGPEATVAQKQVQDAYAMVEVPEPQVTTTLDFFGQVIVDLINTYNRVIAQPITVNQGGGIWGSGTWGVMLWGAATNSYYDVVKIPLQNAAIGHLFQIAISETSTTAWVIIGYAVYVNVQKVGY